MSDTALLVGPQARASGNWTSRLRALFLRSEPIRGYSLLSPTLIVMTLTMCIPFGIMVMMSFWTQHSI